MSFYSRRQKRLKLIDTMIKYYNLGNVNVSFVPTILEENFNRIIKRRKSIKYTGKTFIRNNTLGEYIFDTNSIRISESMNQDDDEFLMTVLHELKHSEQSLRLGTNKFKREYFDETDRLVEIGLDGYENNKFEREAEAFASQEYKRWKRYL